MPAITGKYKNGCHDSTLLCVELVVSTLLLLPSVSVNAVMTLVILFSLKTVELLENSLEIHSGAPPLLSMRTESQASSQGWRWRLVLIWIKLQFYCQPSWMSAIAINGSHYTTRFQISEVFICRVLHHFFNLNDLAGISRAWLHKDLKSLRLASSARLAQHTKNQTLELDRNPLNLGCLKNL